MEFVKYILIIIQLFKTRVLRSPNVLSLEVDCKKSVNIGKSVIANLAIFLSLFVCIDRFMSRVITFHINIWDTIIQISSL